MEQELVSDPEAFAPIPDRLTNESNWKEFFENKELLPYHIELKNKSLQFNYTSVTYKLRPLMSNGLMHINLFSNLVQDGHVGMPARVKENVAFASTHVTFVWLRDSAVIEIIPKS